MIENTEQRKLELKEMMQAALDRGTLTRPEALVLRGKLGFADSFVHGRLGSLVLSKIIEHAYGAQKQIAESLRDALRFMLERLNSGKPRVVRAHRLEQWFIYSDASYEQSNKTGGIGGVLVNDRGECVSWFGFNVDSETCLELGAFTKDTIIYELELFAGVLAVKFWNNKISRGLQVWFGDNEAVRFSLIKGSAEGEVAQTLMRTHLEHEALNSSQAWFARVPTEANISDFPSRGEAHPMLEPELSESLPVKDLFDSIMQCLRDLGCQHSTKGDKPCIAPQYLEREKRSADFLLCEIKR